MLRKKLSFKYIDLVNFRIIICYISSFDYYVISIYREKLVKVVIIFKRKEMEQDKDLFSSLYKKNHGIF